MEEKILFVDDEENILAALRRQLRKDFNLLTANNGSRGLELFSTDGPIAVVVSDFRMPEMNGVQFLKRVKEISPDTSRIMLTGFADLNAVIDAVNDGNIYRFLTKPCSTEVLAKAIQNGLEQYRLVRAERDLLEKTLKASVTLLIEVLGQANPLAFSKALRLRRIVRVIVSNLKLASGWQYEMAALLAPIGCIALPHSILAKIQEGKPLNHYEVNLYNAHPGIGYRLLTNIYRLESIAEMIKDQNRRYDDYDQLANVTESRKAIYRGSQMLHVANDYDQLILTGCDHPRALSTLRARVDEYNPDILQALGEEEIIFNNWKERTVEIGAIEVGMVLNENIVSLEGEIISHKHQEVTQSVLERIKLISKDFRASEPGQKLVKVYLPS